MCEYGVRSQGVEYVKELCLNRPQLTDLSKSNAGKEILNGHIPEYICAKMTDPQKKKQRTIELRWKH